MAEVQPAQAPAAAANKEGRVERPWNWPSEEHKAGADRWVERYGMPFPVAQALEKRGVTEQEAESFLNPRLAGLADPRRLDGMERAVARIWRAIDDGERIFVHGDYDVDGITGTAFVARTLGALGAQVVPFVPNRSEGYGLGEPGIAAARDAGARVLVTVDNGVRAVEEIAVANATGIDVVVLDHHLPGDELPAAHALVNPRLGTLGNVFTDLAAVGVAAKFVHAVAAARPGSLPHEVYKEALQLVALGTIADVVPLTGENRILVAHGLHRLAHSRWVGIQALKAVAGLDRMRVTSTDVAFALAPRINAAGRMGEARDALALLLADDPAEAYRLAEHVEQLNRQRRKVERKMTAEAIGRVETRGAVPPAVVDWDDAWPVGVVGIAANRVLDHFHRPALLIAMEGERGRGSARSRRGFPLPDALAACDDLLEQHGGHAEAAGFEIRREHLEAFRTRMESLAADAELDGTPHPLDIDAAVRPEEIDGGFVRWVDKLAPFGRGNPEPLFGCERMELAEAPAVVGKRHLRLTVKAGNRRLKAIAFNQAARSGELSSGGKVDAVFHAAFDTWRGGETVQLVVRDLRPR
jgi:single-stranded-DNA-specific exonuclease